MPNLLRPHITYDKDINRNRLYLPRYLLAKPITFFLTLFTLFKKIHNAVHKD